MRTKLGFLFALAAAAISFHAAAARAQTTSFVDVPRYTAEQLDNLLAPVALYPDPILAQVLVAASYPEEVDLAARHLSVFGENSIDEQPWDMSVKAVAHYPPVLNLMADRLDWTTALGQAYAQQPSDVMAAVQSLRRMARAHGNLVTTEHHQVVVEDRYLRILPARPKVVYVPVYDPLVVYHRPVVHLGAHRSGWSFGVAFPIGVWLTYDFDWRRRHVYYHGWASHYPGSWIRRSQPYVIINNVYVQSRPRTVVANRKVINRHVDYTRFDRYNAVHRQVAWERHYRADAARHANRGSSSWERGDRSDVGSSRTRSPSWDRSRRVSTDDSNRRALPRSTATSQRGRTDPQRAAPQPQPQRSGQRQAQPRRSTSRTAPQRSEPSPAASRRQPSSRPEAAPTRSRGSDSARSKPASRTSRGEGRTAAPDRSKTRGRTSN